MGSPMNFSDIFMLDYLHQHHITGEGVGIAVLDTGAYPHLELRNLVVFQDYINHRHDFYDDSGHGTHVAGIIGAEKLGAAPDCHLIILKVLDANGEGKTTHVLQAINWVIEHRLAYNIRIINISIGTISRRQTPDQPLISAVERAWDHGITVVTAAGNHGPLPQTITTPGVSHKVITVGACDDRTDPHLPKSYSGRGPTKNCIRKPDIVAPGSKIRSLAASKNGYVKKSGTSMATPFVSGILALTLQRFPDLTPKELKLKLYETSLDLGLTRNQQGWGLINPRGLLEL